MSAEPLDLSPIRARAEKATPGPWIADEDGGWSYGGPKTDLGGRPNLSCTWVERHPRTPGETDPEEIARIRTSPEQGGLPEAWDNQRFIASARTDVPLLLAEVERLREALAGLEMLFSREGESAADRFERVADAFFRETGVMRPGKSQPLEVTHSDEHRTAIYDAWITGKLLVARELLPTKEAPSGS